MSAAVALVALCFLTVLARHLRQAYSRLHELAGPTPWSWILGYRYDLHSAPAGNLFSRWRSKYGQTYKVRGPFGTTELFMGDPKGASHVLGSYSYIRNESNRAMVAEFFGESIFTAEGDFHKQQRAVLNSAFTSANVREVSQVIIDLANKLRADWEDRLDHAGSSSLTLDVSHELQSLAIDAISITTFSYAISDNASLSSLLAKIANLPLTNAALVAESFVEAFPVLWKLPIPIKRWPRIMKSELGKVADRVWKDSEIECMRNDGMHSKLLEAMDNSKVLSGQPMDRDLAIANILAVIFAGYETTASAIGECLHELALQLAIQSKLRAELVSFADITGRDPTYDDLASATQLPYLDAVARETMLTYPIVMNLTREATVEDSIPLQFPVHSTGATHVVVEPGQLVHIPIRGGINNDPDIWGPDAEVFRPERWLDNGKGLPESVKTVRAPGHVLSFGDGPKICVGRHFALAEFKILIATLVRYFHFEHAGVDYDFYRVGSNTVKPKIRGKDGLSPSLELRIKTVSDI
ncbi:cytochrome P450 [Fomitopsis serialis]|uniref:cytochrome P450 n=1 Tax=Fomitopsis serialis TaxID=139415 RepID=UPI002007F6A8|nr:cytochrome P450 [Neoantrodia serialis]KAH9923028.1 cytochrome P450 [Neoantrodia serialis]